jgi:hypothetical protein
MCAIRGHFARVWLAGSGYSARERMLELEENIRPDGALAERLQGFSYRAAQAQMAALVAEALDSGRHAATRRARASARRSRICYRCCYPAGARSFRPARALSKTSYSRAICRCSARDRRPDARRAAQGAQ